jgi:hypothetical protein
MEDNNAPLHLELLSRLSDTNFGNKNLQILFYTSLRTDDTNKIINAWIDMYFLTYFHCKSYK